MVNLFPHPASFRFRLTTDTLAFGYLLPATGRIRVFHPLETCAAERTYKRQCSPIKNGALPFIAVFKIKAYIHKSETSPHSLFDLPFEMHIESSEGEPQQFWF